MDAEESRRLGELVRETAEMEYPRNYSGKILIEANANNGVITEATMSKRLKLK